MFNIHNDVNSPHLYSLITSKCRFSVVKKNCVQLMEMFLIVDHFFYNSSSDRSSPRIFFSGNSDYASRDRCTDDYYTLQPSSMQITDQIHEIGNATMLQNASNSVISSPITIAVQQHQSQIQSPLPQQQSGKFLRITILSSFYVIRSFPKGRLLIILFQYIFVLQSHLQFCILYNE